MDDLTKRLSVIYDELETVKRDYSEDEYLLKDLECLQNRIDEIVDRYRNE